MENQDDTLEKPKTKKERSPAQVESFKNAQEKRKLQAKMKKEQIENVKKDIKSKSFNELKNGVIVEPVKPIIKEEETIYIKKEKKEKKQPKIIYYESETESEEEIIYKKKSKPKVIKEDKKEEPKEIIKPVEPIIKEIKNKIIFC